MTQHKDDREKEIQELADEFYDAVLDIDLPNMIDHDCAMKLATIAVNYRKQGVETNIEEIFEREIGINQELGYKPISKEDVLRCMRAASRYVEIKPLEWGPSQDPYWLQVANTIAGQYRIRRDFRLYKPVSGMDVGHDFNSIAEAEAAANTHHRELVSKCLVPGDESRSQKALKILRSVYANYPDYMNSEPACKMAIAINNAAEVLEAAPVTEGKGHPASGVSAEESVFEGTITKTGEKVWQYFYTDAQGLNQHSEYFKTKGEAIEHFNKRFGITEGKGWTEETVKEFAEWCNIHSWEYLLNLEIWTRFTGEEKTTAELFTEYQRHLESLNRTPYNGE